MIPDATVAADFDHHSAEFAANWRSALREMRATCPVAHSHAHDGFYSVTRHADIDAVLREDRTFASGRDLTGDGWSTAGGVTIPTNTGRMGFMEIDLPVSTQYRRLVNPWLSRAAVAAYRPRILQIADWCIDQFVETGSSEMVHELASPLPAVVTLDALGIPLDDWRTYADAAHGAAFRQPGSGQKLKWVAANVRELVRTGAYHPDGLIASWCRAEIDGQPLEQEIICELIYMVLQGGIDTTTSTISNAIVILDANADVRRQLTSEPERSPAAVQELIRFAVPSTGIARTVLADTEVGGCPVQPGDRLLLLLASANFDEDVFPDADAFRIDRERNPHLSFGVGPHRCVGADLAAAEVEVLLETLLRRIPEFTVSTDGLRRYPTMPLVNGYIKVPCTFPPGQRRSAPSPSPVLTEPRLGPSR